METSDAAAMTHLEGAEEQLSRLFGSYKAEWLRERIFDLFTEPAYFPELLTARPCMLVGGRGTGKTTVLRCLSYEGQFVLSGRDSKATSSAEYYGIYYRVNTNRVTAFRGPELTEPEWTKLFAHYFNLVLCDLVLQFLRWYQLYTTHPIALPPEACALVGSALHLPLVSSLAGLETSLRANLVEFEAYINNVEDGPRPLLSIQSGPIDLLLEAVIQHPAFHGKLFFFLLDEYENLEDYQQQVINTLIKHAGQWYSFKVGVKELGWRRRATLNPNEQLISPADYVRINIPDHLSGEKFKAFAKKVCNDRVHQLRYADHPPITDIAWALPGYSDEAEAEALGVVGETESVKEELGGSATLHEQDILQHLSPLQLYFLRSWARVENRSLQDVFHAFRNDRVEWDTRYDNYKHALLYTIRRRKRGIRKYYAGWDVFTQLAASNIRYLLELVDQSLLMHLRNERPLSEPVPQDTQTHAARYVGRKNLSELEGLSVHGAQLTKLLLGLGRVFGVMAANPLGHTPEVNQFHLIDNGREIGAREPSEDEVEPILNAAVMHLALLRHPGSKLVAETDTREYDYMVHPIYAAFFEFSYRRKRKMAISSRELLDLIRAPKRAIRDILDRSNRTEEDEPLPEQLRLFEAYYRGGS